MPSTPFKLIIDIALTDYAKGVGIDPARHPFADILQNCRSPEDVLGLLESKADDFKDYRDGNRKLIDHLKPVVDVVHALSGILGEAFPGPLQPAKAIFVGVDVLITAAKGVSSAYDALVDLFECIRDFLKRLRIYTDTPLTPFMMNIVAKIMAELLSVLALATKHINQGRFKKFAKKLLVDRDIETALRKLDHLTQEEGRRTMAQTLEVVYGLVNNVKVVMDDGKVSLDGILEALGTMHKIENNISEMRNYQLQEKSRIWLSPPDPSPNYNTARSLYQDGTITWFFQGNIFAEWKKKVPCCGSTENWVQAKVF